MVARLLPAAILVTAPVATFPASMKPDFTHVVTKVVAKALVAQGRLVRILLFPGELGGEDVPANVAYITPEAASVRFRVIATLSRMIRDGSIDKLDVEPTYKGDSVVPSGLRMTATKASEERSLVETISVW
jgi:hypothetical protein